MPVNLLIVFYGDKNSIVTCLILVSSSIKIIILQK